MYHFNAKKIFRVGLVSIFTMSFVFSNIAICEDLLHEQEIKISIAKVERNFVVTIDNISDHDVKINKLLSSDPLIGSIHFVIKEDGLRLPLLAQINSPTPSANSYLELYPGAFYGGVFDASHIERMYGVKKQCYSIQVLYADKFASQYGAVHESASSSEIKVCDSLKEKGKENVKH